MAKSFFCRLVSGRNALRVPPDKKVGLTSTGSNFVGAFKAVTSIGTGRTPVPPFECA